jgi:hypothetical protein
VIGNALDHGVGCALRGSCGRLLGNRQLRRGGPDGPAGLSPKPSLAVSSRAS